MAMKKGPGSGKGSTLPEFDTEKYYTVRLSEPVKHGGRDLPSGAKVVVLGRVAKSIEDKITNATEVTT